MHDAWECGDCGWNVSTSQLPPHRTLQDARILHSEKYCARPPIWTPG